MAEVDPLVTQRQPLSPIVAELAGAGFDDAREVGRGGFGVVYRCLQRSLDRTVAVKVLTCELDPENVERFVREQRAMGRLSGHPNIATILQVGVTESGRPYLVMHYHGQGSLDARIHHLGPLVWPEAVRLGVKLAGALETAHRLEILHRDVKPANILLTAYDEPQLTDFGIARIAGGFETATGAVTGSPAFTAPELFEGQPPSRVSDVYGLGATLFCALTGHAAFERREGERVIAQFLRITTAPIPDLRGEGIPDDACAAVEQAMARDPAERPSTAAEFGEQLRAVEAHHGLRVDEMAVPADVDAAADVDVAADGRSHPDWATISGRRSGPSRHSRTRGYPMKTPTPPAPATRFRPPTPPGKWVGRGRLIDLLHVGGRRRLTLIHGPAGFGKTTLAAQWRDVLTGEGVAVAWLTVDRDDNNVVWFLAHLIEAIRQVRPTLAHGLAQVLEEHGGDADRYVLTTLINEIHQSAQPVAVIIDDWHRVREPATLAAMEYLLDNGCHHLQVIVTSRTRSGLPLGRLRVHDELIEIDAEALRFNMAESTSFLVDLGGLELGPSDIRGLTESTDGWAAALQLASLSLRERGDPTRLIGRLSGRHHAIGEFLAENVLAGLEPEILDFLLATSVTERLCADLASALAPVGGGQVLLEEVERRDLFIRRVDQDGEWFRYHPMFAQFLRGRLERDHPEWIQRLHHTAAGWFAEHAMISAAVDHALAAGEEQAAADLVERVGTDLLERSQLATLLGLVAKLPEDVVASRPRLELALVWANVLLQHPAAAHTALTAVERALERLSPTTADLADLRVEKDVAQALIEIFADRIDRVDELVSECLARPETLRPWVVSTAANFSAIAKNYRFDFDGARRLQEWAFAYHQRTGGPFTAMHGYLCLGNAANEQLDLTAAERHFRQAIEVATSVGIPSHAARLAASFLGALLYEQDRIDEAEPLLDESYGLGSEGGAAENMACRFAVGARLKALRGDRAAAAERLDQGARTAAALSLPRLRARIDNERVRLGLPPTPGIVVPARVEYATRRRPVHDLEAITAQVEEETAILGLLADPTPAHAELACRWATEWVHLTGQARPRALLRANRLLVAALAAAGRTDEAQTLLATIAAQCAERGMIRYLLDGGPHVIDLIGTLRDDQVANRWRPEWPPVPRSFLDALLTASTPERCT